MTRKSPRIIFALAASAAFLALSGCAMTSADRIADKSVSIVAPANGATVSSPFTVKFGVKGMAVAPAGEIVANSGHNHLLINQVPVAEGVSVPMDAQHMHFGKGQTEAQVTLPAGKYKLTSQFANGAHQSFGPGMSATIEVTVK